MPSTARCREYWMSTNIILSRDTRTRVVRDFIYIITSVAKCQQKEIARSRTCRSLSAQLRTIPVAGVNYPRMPHRSVISIRTLTPLMVIVSSAVSLSCPWMLSSLITSRMQDVAFDRACRIAMARLRVCSSM